MCELQSNTKLLNIKLFYSIQQIFKRAFGVKNGMILPL